jgi:ArsR family transcriptional regulator, arsenate/arsenite/antimonite-responsive transcriptional repressor
MMKKIIEYDKQQLQLARFAKALSHPARLQILSILSRQNCCYSGNIAGEFPIALSTLSQHLKELKDAGLIHGEIEHPNIRYCINPVNWEIAKALLTNFFKEYQVIQSCEIKK